MDNGGGLWRWFSEHAVLAFDALERGWWFLGLSLRSTPPQRIVEAVVIALVVSLLTSVGTTTAVSYVSIARIEERINGLEKQNQQRFAASEKIAQRDERAERALEARVTRIELDTRENYHAVQLELRQLRETLLKERRR